MVLTLRIVTVLYFYAIRITLRMIVVSHQVILRLFDLRSWCENEYAVFSINILLDDLFACRIVRPTHFLSFALEIFMRLNVIFNGMQQQPSSLLRMPHIA